MVPPRPEGALPVAAYMLSLLARRRTELGEGFSAEFPDGWLVWEPGPWRPAVTTEARDCFGTGSPEKTPPPQPPGDDAICYQLPPAEPGRQLSLGRASTNDVIVNDATASRHQLVLQADGAGGWQVTVVRGEVTLDGRRLDPSAWAALGEGSCLAIGELRLTYHGPGRLQARLAGAPKAAQPGGDEASSSRPTAATSPGPA